MHKHPAGLQSVAIHPNRYTVHMPRVLVLTYDEKDPGLFPALEPGSGVRWAG